MADNKLKFERNRTHVKYCPCGKSNKNQKFAPYVGFEDKGYCHSCEQTFLPELEQTSLPKFRFKPQPIRRTSFHDKELVSLTGRNFDKNNFVQFLLSRFPKDQVKKAVLKYCLGTSKKWQGANIFWQIDQEGKVRHGKIMLYDKESGKRLKSPQGTAYISSVRSALDLKDFNLSQCLFGLHLISESKAEKVAIVEGEKTAVLMSLLMPSNTWIATGSKQGFKYDLLSPLRGLNVIAFPDKGEFADWEAVAQELNGIGFNIRIDNYLEERTDLDRGTDLADVLLSLHLPGQDLPDVNAKYGGQQSPEKAFKVPNHEESMIKHLAAINPAMNILIDVFDLVTSAD